MKSLQEQQFTRSTDRSSLAAPSPGGSRKWLWLSTAALTGMVIMALELAAFRLYAPYFGYSIYVWGSMIGVIMAALAAGYALGGRAADRCLTDLTLYLVILFGAAYQFIMLLAGPGLLTMLSRAGEITGPVTATLIIFLPPMIALATAGPFVTRLLARARQIGSAAGTVSAISTLGSLAGVFGASFWMAPTFGTRATLATACALTGVVAIAGLVSRSRVTLALLGFVAALPLIPQEPSPQGTVWSAESAYNLVRVVHRRGRSLLLLNRELGAHTVRDDLGPWTGMYYDEFAIGPLLSHPERALVLGMGGGASIGTLRAAAPQVRIDAVEIDPRVVDAAERFFGIPRNDPLLKIHVADARPWLSRSTGTWDIIQIDLYHGGPYIPFYLATVEFFQLTRAHVADDGVLMMNLFDITKDHELLDPIVATLGEVFGTVACLPCGRGSYILCAFPGARDIKTIQGQLQPVAGPSMVSRLAKEAAGKIYLPRRSSAQPFTDDRSAIEQITRRMLRKAEALSASSASRLD